MKVFFNDACYVNIQDLVKKAIPSYIKLDKYLYEGNEFIKLTDKQAIDYMKNRSDIIDYDDVKDLTSEELELKISVVYKTIEDYAHRWYNEKYYRRKGTEIDKKFLDDYKLAEVIYNELLKYQKNKKEIDNMITSLLSKYGINKTFAKAEYSHGFNVELAKELGECGFGGRLVAIEEKDKGTYEDYAKLEREIFIKAEENRKMMNLSELYARESLPCGNDSFVKKLKH